MFNYFVASIFATIFIGLLLSGPQNWAIVPFLVLMSVLFFKKKGKEGFWEPGMKLFNPLLCFYFVVTFIQSLGNPPDSFYLWFNGLLVVVTAVNSYYVIAIKPKK